MVSQQLMLSVTDVNVMLYISLDVVGRCYCWQMLFAKDVMAIKPL